MIVGSKTTRSNDNEEALTEDGCILKISESIAIALFGTYYVDQSIYQMTLKVYQQLLKAIYPVPPVQSKYIVFTFRY